MSVELILNCPHTPLVDLPEVVFILPLFQCITLDKLSFFYNILSINYKCRSVFIKLYQQQLKVAPAALQVFYVAF